ncbi:type I secretion system permease/ATPase [Microvirga soli]|uniref:type I secretion system permease/ATPase n=1 Tax=Microvirga soli TaxID=1854496 RepID=UPI00191F0804|nr:type I secretion system permease/ATPase [Microvirga soli]
MAQSGEFSGSEMGQALKASWVAFLGVGLFSGAINILALTGAMFMLQVYDRVVPSRSIPTLIGLAAVAAALFLVLGLLDIIRTRLLVRIGVLLHQRLSARVFGITLCLPLVRSGTDAQRPLRDLDQVRSFLSSGGPLALFDLPWLPFYLAIGFLFHPVIGWTALGGAIVLVTIMLLTAVFSRRASRVAMQAAGTRQAVAEAGRRNAEVVAAMGMGPAIAAQWHEADQQFIASQQRLSDVSGGFGAFSKMLRMALQSAVLGVGALLVIRGEATAGIIIAASIISSRSLAPVEHAIAHWKSFIAARQSWRKLREVLAAVPSRGDPLPLRKPVSTLSVQGISITPPGDPRLLVRNVSFQLESGMGLGILGPSGSGKTCLARALVGAWAPARGKVRLDMAALDQWLPEMLGQHIGYLPQDGALFAGTVAQNIARFRTGDDPDLVIQAATLAGVHELILSLPQGYETLISEGGAVLSAGQRQRVGLARALYGNPFLVVLDEPNSNLDAEGEEALVHALLSVRARGGIAVVIAHRPSVMAALDHALVMAGGEVRAFGAKDQVLQQNVRTIPYVVPMQLAGRSAS